MSSRRQFLRGVAGGLTMAGSGLFVPRLAFAADKFNLAQPMLPDGDIAGSFLSTLPCEFNRSMQQICQIVRRVFRSLGFS